VSEAFKPFFFFFFLKPPVLNPYSLIHVTAMLEQHLQNVQASFLGGPLVWRRIELQALRA